MDLVWAAGGALAGLVAGAALRGPLFRLAVPRGAEPRTQCPRCFAVVRAPAGTPAFWLVSRCAYCRAAFGAPSVLVPVTAVVLALLFGRFAGRPDLPAFAFLGVLGVLLAAIDLAVERLPDRLTLPAYPVLVVLLGAAAVVGHDGGALLRAVAGGAAMGGGYLLLAVLRPGQLGGGDIKLAGLVGLALGWLGWPVLVMGAALGFLLSAVVILVLLAARKITLGSDIAFGPFLLGGALFAAVGIG